MTSSAPESGQNYISPAEFAERSGLSSATVRRYLKAGKIPYYQPGGFRRRIFIPADALHLQQERSEITDSLVHTPAAIELSENSGRKPKWMQKLPKK